jgi:hypothetical protein
MLGLISCEYCGHGVIFHSGTGCEAERCSCVADKDRLLENLIERTKTEIARERALEESR